MSNHPNRGKARGPCSSPRPESVRQARTNLGLTVKQAAALVCETETAWKRWEAGERPMHAGLWQLFCRQTGWPVAV